MFNNIGGKIKGLAKFICWVGIIISVLAGIFIIYNGKMTYGDYFQKDIKAYYIMLAFIVMIVGSLLSWLAVILFYGYGELIENTSKLVELKTREININKGTGTTSAHWPTRSDDVFSNNKHWVCSGCGKQNPWTTSVCICGVERPAKNTSPNQVVKKESWICPNCGKQNPGYSSVCLCGGQRPTSE